MPLWATDGGHLSFSAIATYRLDGCRQGMPLHATLLLLDVLVKRPGQQLIFAFGADEAGFGAATNVSLSDYAARVGVERALSRLASLVGQVLPPGASGTEASLLTATPHFAQHLDDLYAAVTWDDEGGLNADNGGGTPPSAAHLQRVADALDRHRPSASGVGAVRLDRSGRYVLAFTHAAADGVLDTLWDGTEHSSALVLATNAKHFCYHSKWAVEQGPAHQRTMAESDPILSILDDLRLPGCPAPLVSGSLTGVLLQGSATAATATDGRRQNACLHVIAADGDSQKATQTAAAAAASRGKSAAGNSHSLCTVM